MALTSIPNENNVLARIAHGDHRSFCILFDHYQGYVYAFGKKLTKSEHQAEEIVQDIFMKIWQVRETLAGIDNFPSYLTRLVQNQSYSILRKRVVQKRFVSERNRDRLSWINDLNRDLDMKETVRLLDEILQNLPPQQRKAYELCHQQGLKYEEAAKEMNISTDTVHYHMKLALKAIRTHFRKNLLLYPVLIGYLFKG